MDTSYEVSRRAFAYSGMGKFFKFLECILIGLAAFALIYGGTMAFNVYFYEEISQSTTVKWSTAIMSIFFSWICAHGYSTIAPYSLLFSRLFHPTKDGLAVYAKKRKAELVARIKVIRSEMKIRRKSISECEKELRELKDLE